MTFLTELGAALAAGRQDRGAGRERLAKMWATLTGDDRAGRCVLAHYLADFQDDLAEEVRWDGVALANAEGLTDAELRALHPSLTVQGFIPSLQLNVADGLRRQGRFSEATAALEVSVANDSALPIDLPAQVAYRDTIVAAQERVGGRIRAHDTESLGP